MNAPLHFSNKYTTLTRSEYAGTYYGNLPATLSGQTLAPGQNMYGNVHAAYSGQTLAPNSIANLHPEHVNSGVDNIVGSFENLNLRNGAPMGQGKPSATGTPIGEPNPMLYQLPDGTYMLAGTSAVQGSYQYPTPYNIAVTHPTQYQQATYQGIPSAGVPIGPHTPRNYSWVPSQGLPHVPDLVAPRRTSWSSTEELSPQTPVDGYQPAILVPGHSPSDWSTNPSPLSGRLPNNQQICRQPNGEYAIADFWVWTQAEPAIPAPVPAWRSGPDGGRGSLDKILDNRDGTTNVYVRGLRPDTTDELLAEYGRRFGEIVSQKAIIDMSNNTCKGFGFIKYNSYFDAENCIRAFFYLGYEAKFARQSHNARLKELADPKNNNLYVSNLPRLWNDKDFENLFKNVYPDYHILEQRILKDGNGISRGVGFARFETPEICENIISTFNNMTVGEGKHATELQLRYADTEKQKQLKTCTAERRQFKTNEYNEAVYGPGSPYGFYSPLSATFQSPVPTRAPGTSGAWSGQSSASSISPAYVGYPNSVLNGHQGTNVSLPNASVKPEGPAPARRTTHIKIESPSVAAAAKKAAVEAVDNELPDGESSSTSDEDTLVCKSKSSKTCSGTGGDVTLSPTKSKL